MNSLSAASQTAPASPVDEATRDLRDAQFRTNDLLGLLAQRLESVLKPMMPRDATGGPKAVNTGLSPLHAELLESAERAALLNDRLQETIDRLVVG